MLLTFEAGYSGNHQANTLILDMAMKETGDRQEQGLKEGVIHTLRWLYHHCP
jgi:hypothetical protein